VRIQLRYVVSVSAGVAMLACGGKDRAMSDDLRKDLEMAGTADAITLATPAASQQQIVSAIERTTPPAPKRVAQSQRVPRHKPAPKLPPEPVEAQKADVSEEIAVQPVEVAPAPVEPAPTPSPRPRPVATDNGSGTERGSGGGANIGSILGGVVSVVLRGGMGGIDECDPRTDGRRPGTARIPISINQRIPVIGTFPGSIPGSGRRGRFYYIATERRGYPRRCVEY
jgi:hypothetical protein